MYITLSETYAADFTLKLNPKLKDDPGCDLFASKIIGLSANGGSAGYMETATNVTVVSGTRQLVVYLYPLGADGRTQNGIEFNPEIVEPEPKEKYGTVSGCTVSLYDCKPTVVSPTAADSLSADKKRGCDIAIEIIDSYRDLNAPQLYTVEYTWVGGGTAGSVENREFRAGQATTITAQGFATTTTGVKIRVKDAQGNYSSWSEAVPVFVEATKTVKPELVRTRSETEEAIDDLSFAEGDTAYLRFRVEPDTAANMSEMYAFLVPLNKQSSNLVTSTALTEGVPFEAEKTVSKVISTAALTFLDGCKDAEDLRFLAAVEERVGHEPPAVDPDGDERLRHDGERLDGGAERGPRRRGGRAVDVYGDA